MTTDNVYFDIFIKRAAICGVLLFGITEAIWYAINDAILFHSIIVSCLVSLVWLIVTYFVWISSNNTDYIVGKIFLIFMIITAIAGLMFGDFWIFFMYVCALIFLPIVFLFYLILPEFPKDFDDDDMTDAD